MSTRLPRAFEGLELEADEVANDEYERSMSRHGSPDEDMGTLAERASDLGLERYEALQAMETAVYGSLTVLLHHWHEQWLLELYREKFAPLGSAERDWLKKPEPKKAVEAFGCTGLDLKKNGSWGKIEELRLLANAVKHGQGKSCDELFEVAPDYFEPSHFDHPRSMNAAPTLIQPLGGFGGIYVNDSDLLVYCEALRDFWRETEESFMARTMG